MIVIIRSKSRAVMRRGRLAECHNRDTAAPAEGQAIGPPPGTAHSRPA